MTPDKRAQADRAQAREEAAVEAASEAQTKAVEADQAARAKEAEVQAKERAAREKPTRAKPGEGLALVANVKIAYPDEEAGGNAVRFIQAEERFDAPDKAAYDRALERGYARRLDEDEGE